MTKDSWLALAMVVICLLGVRHLYSKVRADWKTPEKRGVNIVFVLAIVGGSFLAIASALRVLMDAGFIPKF